MSGCPSQRSHLGSVHFNWIKQDNTDRAIRLVLCPYWAVRHYTTAVGTSRLHKKSTIGVRSSSSGVIKELLFEKISMENDVINS